MTPCVFVHGRLYLVTHALVFEGWRFSPPVSGVWGPCQPGHD